MKNTQNKPSSSIIQDNLAVKNKLDNFFASSNPAITGAFIVMWILGLRKYAETKLDNEVIDLVNEHIKSKFTELKDKQFASISHKDALTAFQGAENFFKTFLQKPSKINDFLTTSLLLFPYIIGRGVAVFNASNKALLNKYKEDNANIIALISFIPASITTFANYFFLRKELPILTSWLLDGQFMPHESDKLYKRILNKLGCLLLSAIPAIIDTSFNVEARKDFVENYPNLAHIITPLGLAIEASTIASLSLVFARELSSYISERASKVKQFQKNDYNRPLFGVLEFMGLTENTVFLYNAMKVYSGRGAKKTLYYIGGGLGMIPEIALTTDAMFKATKFFKNLASSLTLRCSPYQAQIDEADFLENHARLRGKNNLSKIHLLFSLDAIATACLVLREELPFSAWAIGFILVAVAIYTFAQSCLYLKGEENIEHDIKKRLAIDCLTNLEILTYKDLANQASKRGSFIENFARRGEDIEANRAIELIESSRSTSSFGSVTRPPSPLIANPSIHQEIPLNQAFSW
jgi:hypothetical protein